jgi:pimeloyl-ACP methyl ester carboxylesterase
VRSIDAGTPGLATLTERAAEDVNHVIDHLFWRLVVLGIILIVGAFGGALAYRMLARRFA